MSGGFDEQISPQGHPAMTKVEEIDALLTRTRAAFLTYTEQGRLVEADAAYLLLDHLLDQRLHLPLQREGT